MVLLIVLLAFVTGVLLALALAAPSPRQEAVNARIDRIRVSPGTARATPAQASDAPTTLRPIRAFLRFLGGPFGSRPSIRMLIERSGPPLSLDVAEFAGLRVLSTLLFLFFAPFVAHGLGVTLPMRTTAALLVVIVGSCLPDAWLQGQISVRQAQIRKSLPDVLDVLVVSMEAGVGFDAAVAQAASAMRGPLPDEFRRALQEMRLGRTRADALREMASRAAVAELTSFVSAVTQADRLGAGVASTLRIQSETVRTQRMQRIREAAARLPTKMLLPLVFFLLPALFVVLLGPGLINLMRVLSH